MTTVNITPESIQSISSNYADKHPHEIIALALQAVDSIAISFSGAEDVVLIDMATKIKPQVQVFCLDTGRLHEETYAFIERVKKHYGIVIDAMMPNEQVLTEFVEQNGLYSFYETGHHACCSIRKTEPLKRKLATLDGWITGQRKDQSPDTRNHIAIAEIDTFFATEGKTLYKFNPLASWSSSQVWEYIRENNIPYNELHDRSYRSIGCEPCTRAVKPDEHERAGRWWWEEATAKECGLHQGNIITKT